MPYSQHILYNRDNLWYICSTSGSGVIENYGQSYQISLANMESGRHDAYSKISKARFEV